MFSAPTWLCSVSENDTSGSVLTMFADFGKKQAAPLKLRAAKQDRFSVSKISCAECPNCARTKFGCWRASAP